MLMGHKSSLIFLQFIGQTERSKHFINLQEKEATYL